MCLKSRRHLHLHLRLLLPLRRLPHLRFESPQLGLVVGLFLLAPKLRGLLQRLRFCLAIGSGGEVDTHLFHGGAKLVDKGGRCLFLVQRNLLARRLTVLCR